MTSILTNTSAMAALQTLRTIGSSMAETQGQVSSGLRVQTAADNAAYWSIATTMRSDGKALSAASDAIEFTSAVLATAYAGMDAIREEYTTVRNLLITASQMPEPKIDYPYSAIDIADTVDPDYGLSQQAKVAQEIDQHMQQIRTILQSSSFGGVNLLYVGDDSPVKASTFVNSFVTGFADGKVLSMDIPLKDTLLVNDSNMDDATFTNLDPGDGGIFDMPLNLTVTGSDGLTHATGLPTFTTWQVTWQGGDTQPIERSNDMVRTIEMYVQRYGADRQAAWNYVIPQVDAQLQSLINAMSTLGSLQNAVRGYDEIVKRQADTIDKGIGRLVDAEMNEASTRFKALQTQEQLAIQSLQIANSNAENVTQLFR